MINVWIDGFEQISCAGVGSEALSNKLGSDAAYWGEFYPYAAVDEHFDFCDITGRKESLETRQMDHLAKCIVACAHRSLEKSGTEADSIMGERTGIIVGSAFGCTGSNHIFLETLLEAGPRRTSPIVFRNTVSNAVAGHLAIAFRITGPNSVFNSGMVSGPQALAYAFEEIENGDCDFVLSGAGDRASELIRRRFLLHGDAFGRGKLPLMDGACMMLLRSGRMKSRPGGWQLMGYGMGFLHKEEFGTSFARIVQMALQKANLRSNEVDVIQLQSDCSAFWVRSSTSDSLEAASTELLQKIHGFPFQENTAVPVMLSLMASLISLPEGRIPRLFLNDDVVIKLESIPEHFLFASIGSDGNTVILVLKQPRES